MKLSTRRQLSVVLGIACGLLMVLTLLQRQLGWGTSYSLLPDVAAEPDPSLKEPLKESRSDLGSENAYLWINEHALFTQNRQAPTEATPPPPVAESKVPKVPLTAQLTGVVITPSRKVALLRNAGGDQSYRLREGMPFPGDLAGWRVLQINARSVVFDGGGDQGQVELKLDVAKGAPIPGPGQPGFNPNGMPQPPFVPQVAGNSPVPPMNDASKINSNGMVNNTTVPPPLQQPPPPQPAPNADQAAREAEVQRIIEERRAQMRAEAERMNSGNQ